MKLPQRADLHVLLASLIWGVILQLALRGSRQVLTDDGLFNIVWLGGNLLIPVIYPLLVTYILHRKTKLWINTFSFACLGVILAFWGVMLAGAVQNKFWLQTAFFVIAIGMTVQTMLSSFERIPALLTEWDSPLWERLNQCSLIEFLFLQFHSLEDIAD